MKSTLFNQFIDKSARLSDKIVQNYQNLKNQLKKNKSKLEKITAYVSVVIAFILFFIEFKDSVVNLTIYFLTIILFFLFFKIFIRYVSIKNQQNETKEKLKAEKDKKTLELTSFGLHQRKEFFRNLYDGFNDINIIDENLSFKEFHSVFTDNFSVSQAEINFTTSVAEVAYIFKKLKFLNKSLILGTFVDSNKFTINQEKFEDVNLRKNMNDQKSNSHKKHTEVKERIDLIFRKALDI